MDAGAIVKAVAEVPGFLKEVYGDLAKPGVQQAGKALATVIGFGNTILWPMAWANERSRIALENNLEKYRKRLENTAPEEIIGVAPEVGVPICEKLTYVTNEQLSDMYVELLAKASTKSDVEYAHPSFVTIINNLSPDEAVLLKKLRSISDLPFIETRLKIAGGNIFKILNEMHSPLSKCIGISFPNMIQAYISNFEGLGIIQIHTDLLIADDNQYSSLRMEMLNEYGELEKNEKSKIEFRKGKISVTSFGKLFLKACFAKTA